MVRLALNRAHALSLQPLAQPFVAAVELPAHADERSVEHPGYLFPGQALDVVERDAQPALFGKLLIGLPEPATAVPRLVLFGRARARAPIMRLLVEALTQRDMFPPASRPEPVQVAPLDDDFPGDVQRLDFHPAQERGSPV